MSGHATTGPISLRISVTDRCQLRCIYCMPACGVPKRSHSDVLTFEQIVRFVRTVKRRFGLSKVHLTGGEPLLRTDIDLLVAMLAEQGAPDLAVTTNGQLLGQLAGRLKDAGLKRVNISIDSLAPETFCRVTRGGELQRTLDGLDAALDSRLAPVKINVTVLRNVNTQQIAGIARFGLHRGCEVRFLELMPIGPAAGQFDHLFVSSAEVKTALSEAFDLSPLPGPPGGTSRRFLVTDTRGRKGVIGFISPVSEPFCAGCRRLRVTACGQLVGCLAIGRGPDIRALLRRSAGPDPDQLVRAVREALGVKRSLHAFPTKNLMTFTGG